MTHAPSIRGLAGLLILVLAALSAPVVAQTMQPGLVMQVTSERGQVFPAESTRGPAAIPLKAWNYSVSVPLDQGGMQSGSRRYAPITIEKPIGNASPHILRALLSGETLTITVDVVGIGPQGTPVLLHRAVFGHARILSVDRKGTGPAGGDRATSPGEMLESVTFNFLQVEFDPGRSGGSILDEIQVN